MKTHRIIHDINESVQNRIELCQEQQQIFKSKKNELTEKINPFNLDSKFSFFKKNVSEKFKQQTIVLLAAHYAGLLKIEIIPGEYEIPSHLVDLCLTEENGVSEQQMNELVADINSFIQPFASSVDLQKIVKNYYLAIRPKPAA